MKNSLLSLFAAVLVLAAGMPAAQAAMANADHIDFALQVNLMNDSNPDVKDGGGFWLGYRHSLNPNFSLGGKLGAHSYNIESGSGIQDTVTSVPLLFNVQFERNFERSFIFYGGLGIGPSFNSIKGDLTDAFNLKLDTSLALDINFGGLVEINPNIALGLGFDWFISAANVTSNLGVSTDVINLTHFGIGFVLVGSF